MTIIKKDEEYEDEKPSSSFGQNWNGWFSRKFKIIVLEQIKSE